MYDSEVFYFLFLHKHRKAMVFIHGILRYQHGVLLEKGGKSSFGFASEFSHQSESNIDIAFSSA